MVEIEPTRDHPLPFDLSDEEPPTHKDKLAVAVNTASLLEQLGGTIDMTEEDEHAAHALIKGAKDKKTTRALVVPGVAKKLGLLLSEYDHQIIKDAQQARTFITNRLLELSVCGDVKTEIKALELLGKHSDVGLFTERSEITITHKTSSDLENSIKDRIKRLLNADVVDVEPLISQLEEPLDLAEPTEPANVG
jgi:hypothetical protein